MAAESEAAWQAHGPVEEQRPSAACSDRRARIATIRAKRSAREAQAASSGFHGSGGSKSDTLVAFLHQPSADAPVGAQVSVPRIATATRSAGRSTSLDDGYYSHFGSDIGDGPSATASSATSVCKAGAETALADTLHDWARLPLPGKDADTCERHRRLESIRVSRAARGRVQDDPSDGARWHATEICLKQAGNEMRDVCPANVEHGDHCRSGEEHLRNVTQASLETAPSEVEPQMAAIDEARPLDKEVAAQKDVLALTMLSAVPGRALVHSEHMVQELKLKWLRYSHGGQTTKEAPACDFGEDAQFHALRVKWHMLRGGLDAPLSVESQFRPLVAPIDVQFKFIPPPSRSRPPLQPGQTISPRSAQFLAGGRSPEDSVRLTLPPAAPLQRQAPAAHSPSRLVARTLPGVTAVVPLPVLAEPRMDRLGGKPSILTPGNQVGLRHKADECVHQ